MEALRVQVRTLLGLRKLLRSLQHQSADPVVQRLLPHADSIEVGLRFSLGPLPSFNAIHALPVPSGQPPGDSPPHRNVVVILGQSFIVIADPPAAGDDSTRALSVCPIHHTMVRGVHGRGGRDDGGWCGECMCVGGG
jgi:hypothetical protein